MQAKAHVNGNGNGHAANLHGLMEVPRVDSAEASLVARIREFKNPNETWWQNLADFADYPLDKLGDLAFENRAGDRLDPVVLGAARQWTGLAFATLKPDSIIGAYKKRGIGVDQLGDISHLEISEINASLGSLATKYQCMGAAIGATSGVFGAVGAVGDISLVFLLALRAIGEYGTYFGFRVHEPAERDYAILVLATASTVTDGGRQQALLEVTRVGKYLAQDRSGPAQRKLTSDLLKKLTQAVLVRLVKGRLAMIVPGSGPIIGGGYDTLFLAETCKTAYMLYAERWMMGKHGPGVAVDVGAPF